MFFNIEDINNIPKDLKEKLSDQELLCFDTYKTFESKDLSTIKALIKIK